MINIFDFEEIKHDISFYHETHESQKDVEHYFCSCGTHFKNVTNEKKLNIEDSFLPTSSNININEDYFDGFEDILRDAKLSSNDKLICPNCKKDYVLFENRKNIINTNRYFISGFGYQDNDAELTLYCSKAKAVYDDESIKFEEVLKYIKYNKKTKKFFITPNFGDDEIEMTLSHNIKFINDFFSLDTDIISNIYSLHIYIGILSKYVVDVKNINIVSELLNEVRNKVNDAGLPIIKKIISIFSGIIQYSNLSTVALTKGPTFLYDLMKECDIPDSEILKKNELTSPLEIFNFLIKNYINKLNEKINEENKEILDFVYTSKNKQQHLNIKIKDSSNYKSGKVTNISGKYKVLNVIKDGSISKFMFKKIKRFKDYEQIIKYTKFLNKNEIIKILMEKDINVLCNIIDLIYFRDGIDIKELYRLINILVSFAEDKTRELNAYIHDKGFIDYSYMKEFDFSFYDDSIMMINALKFDRKKEFDKIKTYESLIKFHDEILSYFKVENNKEMNQKFTQFVEKFKYLENKDNYDGKLDIKIISTPNSIIKEGKEMKHSGSSYYTRIANQGYLMCQVFDRSEDIPKEEFNRFTLGLNYDPINGLEFDQVKCFGNGQGSDRFKKMMIDWLIIKDISFKPVRDLKIRG